MNNKKNLLIIIPIIILLLIIIGIVLWKSDLFKSPKELFLKYTYQNAKLLPEYDYNETVNKLNKISGQNYETTGKITFNVNSQYANDDNYNIKQVKEEIEKLNINYNVKSIGKENKNSTDFNIQYNNNDILKLELLNNQNKYGIKYSDFYDKYLYIENNNLKQLAEKLGLDSTYVPDKIENISLYDLIYINNVEIERIIKEYSDIINSCINIEKFSTTKNVEINYNNEKIKTNKYTLKISNKELLDLYIRILEKLKSDDATLDIIIDKINKIGFYYNSEELNKENLKIFIQNKIDNSINKVVEEKNYEISVYEYKNKTIRTELILEENSIVINLLDTNKNKVKAEILFNTQYGNQQKLMINKEDVKESDKNKTSYDIDIIYYDGTTFNLDIISEQSGNIDSTYEVKNIFKIGNAQFNIKINQEEKTEFNKDITVENFDDANSVNLNNESVENINKIIKDGIINIQNNIEEKLKIMGIDEESLESVINYYSGYNKNYEYDDYYDYQNYNV